MNLKRLLISALIILVLITYFIFPKINEYIIIKYVSDINLFADNNYLIVDNLSKSLSSNCVFNEEFNSYFYYENSSLIDNFSFYEGCLGFSVSRFMNSIPYKNDSSNELIIYPEILNGGDCEDLGVLAKMLLLNMGKRKFYAWLNFIQGSDGVHVTVDFAGIGTINIKRFESDNSTLSLNE